MRRINRIPLLLAAAALLCASCARPQAPAPDDARLRARDLERAAALGAEAQATIARANALGAEAQKIEGGYADKDIAEAGDEVARESARAADNFLQAAAMFGEAAGKLSEASRLEHLANALKEYFAAKAREFGKHSELVDLRGRIPTLLSKGQIRSPDQLQSQAEDVGRRAARVQAEEERHRQEAERIRRDNEALFQEIAGKLPS